MSVADQGRDDVTYIATRKAVLYLFSKAGTDGRTDLSFH